MALAITSWCGCSGLEVIWLARSDELAVIHRVAEQSLATSDGGIFAYPVRGGRRSSNFHFAGSTEVANGTTGHRFAVLGQLSYV